MYSEYPAYRSGNAIMVAVAFQLPPLAAEPFPPLPPPPPPPPVAAGFPHDDGKNELKGFVFVSLSLLLLLLLLEGSVESFALFTFASAAEVALEDVEVEDGAAVLLEALVEGEGAVVVVVF